MPKYIDDEYIQNDVLLTLPVNWEKIWSTQQMDPVEGPDWRLYQLQRQHELVAASVAAFSSHSVLMMAMIEEEDYDDKEE